MQWTGGHICLHCKCLGGALSGVHGRHVNLPCTLPLPDDCRGTAVRLQMQRPQAGAQVKCKVGDIVSKGQVVVVLEAMKMEYPITAPAAGQVSTSGLCQSACLCCPATWARGQGRTVGCEADQTRHHASRQSYRVPMQQQPVCSRTAWVRRRG